MLKEEEKKGIDVMYTPEDLREMANKKNESDGKSFVELHLTKIQSRMKERARQGLYELTIISTDELNIDNWLSKPYFYNPMIKELEGLGFKVVHSDDVKDGTYLVARW